MNTELKPRAHRIRDAFRRIGIGPTKGYEEVNAGRIKVRKIGKSSIVLDEDLEAYLRSLPTLEPKAAV